MVLRELRGYVVADVHTWILARVRIAANTFRVS
jgi:hypothetical protein